MASRRRDEQAWMPAVARAIVREGKTMREAASELAVDLTSVEAENYFRTGAFQKILRCERNRYYNEIASDPERSKTTAVGMLLLSLEKMADAGEYKDVAESVLRLAKIEGWLGADTEVKVFGDLTGRDFERIRERIADSAGSKRAVESAPN